jgi:hypothetical protein
MQVKGYELARYHRSFQAHGRGICDGVVRQAAKA